MTTSAIPVAVRPIATPPYIPRSSTEHAQQQQNHHHHPATALSDSETDVQPAPPLQQQQQGAATAVGMKYQEGAMVKRPTSWTAPFRQPLSDTSVHFIAGALGGGLGSFLTMPLEVVRTRLQARYNKKQIATNEGLLRGTATAIRLIYQSEGIPGLWRGLGPSLTGVVPSRAVQFSTYTLMKKQLEPWLGDGAALHLTAGSIAGMVSAIAMSPVWLVKTRLQLQTKEMVSQGLAYKNSWDCVRRVYREEGVRAFYKGLGASLIGISGLSIQFTLYEKGKAFVLAQKEFKTEKQKLSPVEYLAVASLSKGIASVVTYPHEVLRTRFREQRWFPGKQPKYTGIVQSFKLIAKEEGVAGLYGGMGPHLLKVVPNSAFMFLTYEVVVHLLTPDEQDD